MDLPDARNEFRQLFLIEKSHQKHVSISWLSGGEPNVFAPNLRQVVLSRVSFSEPVLSRYSNEFLFSFPAATPSLKRASHVAAVVVSRVFAPEKWLTLSKVIAEVYRNTEGNAQAVQAAWLSAFAHGKIHRSLVGINASPILKLPSIPMTKEDTVWESLNFDPAKTFRPTGAKAILSQIGVEVILVWTALMLKRRVAVVGQELSRVIRSVRVLSLLIAHRYSRLDGKGSLNESPAAISFPYVSISNNAFTDASNDNFLDFSSTESSLAASFLSAINEATSSQIEDLKKAASYIAGFTDISVVQRGGELYDVCVVLEGSLESPTARVVVADAAKSEMVMGSAHKEVAKALVEALEDPNCTDASPLAAIAGKSSQLIEKLTGLFPSGVKSTEPETFISALRANGIPKNLETFLFGVACAEPRLAAR